MPKIELRDGRIAVHTDFHEKDLIRSVPGSKWEQDVWTVPKSWASYVTLTGVFPRNLECGNDVASWVWDYYNQQVKPAIELRSLLDAEGEPALFPFQRAGVKFLHHTEHAILADEMGTGKTIQAIDMLKGLEDPFPCLVIAPNGVKRKWQREFEKWWPGLTTVVVRGSAKKRRDALASPAHVYIMNWESIRLHSRLAPYGSLRLKRCRACGGAETVSEGMCEVHVRELNLMGLRTVIADEAHRLFDPHAKWTRAVWAVGHGGTVRYRYALTGTPLANAPDDTWGILHFIAPDEWPSRTKYIDRYCLKSWNMWGGLDVIGVRPETRQEFYAVLDPRMRRMPKDLVLPMLPPKLRDIRFAEMTTKQAKAYLEMERQLATRLEDGTIVYSSNNLTGHLRLMQFSSSYATVNGDNDVKLTEPSNKLDELDEVLQELGWKWATKSTPVRVGEPVVVFAESRQLIEMAAKRMEAHGVRHFIVSGGQTDDMRDNYVVAFNDGPPSVILVVIKAGGEGIDLTRARHAVFLQRSWSMLGNKQAEDRVHRIGSEVHNKIEIIDIVAPDTVEVEQILKLHEKMRRLEEIVRDKQTLRELGDVTGLQLLESEEDSIMKADL